MNAATALRALLGGDAPRSAAVTVKRTGRRSENTRVVLVAHLPADHDHTRDVADRAHDDRDSDGLLLPGAVAAGARARVYPRHQMTSRGVAHDSAFDELYERQRWLDQQVGGVVGVSYACGGGANAGSTAAAIIRRAGTTTVVAVSRRHRRAW
jgi:hypothetical protein